MSKFSVCDGVNWNRTLFDITLTAWCYRAREQENQNFKTRIDLLQKSQRENIEQIAKVKEENEQINDVIELLYPKQVIRNILDEDNRIVSWEETFNTPEEYIESKHPKIEGFHKHLKRKQK